MRTLSAQRIAQSTNHSDLLASMGRKSFKSDPSPQTTTTACSMQTPDMPNSCESLSQQSYPSTMSQYSTNTQPGYGHQLPNPY